MSMPPVGPRALSAVRCVAFDFDNTLVDSAVASQRRHIAFAQEFQASLAPPERLREILTSGDTPELIFRRCHPGCQALYPTYRRWRRVTLERFPVEPFHYTKPLLHQLWARELELAILSQRDGGLRQALLAIDLPADRFLLIQDGTSTRPPKPDPAFFDDLVGRCASRSIAREQIVYCDDALPGWIAARDSGLRFVGVATGSVSRLDFRRVGTPAVTSLATFARYVRRCS